MPRGEDGSTLGASSLDLMSTAAMGINRNTRLYYFEQIGYIGNNLASGIEHSPDAFVHPQNLPRSGLPLSGVPNLLSQAKHNLVVEVPCPRETHTTDYVLPTVM